MLKKPLLISSDNCITVGARKSPLSECQVQEVFHALRSFHPEYLFETYFLATTGDLDRQTSLRNLDLRDFFTKEIDEEQLKGTFRISIHSAKDLPNFIKEGLTVVALTEGVDPSDVLVLPEGKTLGDLPKGAKVGTSTISREESLKELRDDLIPVDIRGTIGERLDLLNSSLEGVIMAKAALIRLGLKHYSCIPLPGKSHPLQGKLAVVARKGDIEMAQLFRCIDSRQKTA